MIYIYIIYEYSRYININIYIYINIKYLYVLYIYIVICAWHYLRSTAIWKDLAMAGFPLLRELRGGEVCVGRDVAVCCQP